MWKSIPARIFTFLLLLVVAIIGPWWLALLILLVGSWLFPNFYEALVAAFIFDLIYSGRGGTTIFNFQFMGTLIVAALVALIGEIRDHSLFQSK